MGFLHGKFGLPSQGKASCNRVALPNLGCMLVVCFHNPPNIDMYYRTFNVCTDVNACDCARGCTDTRVCTESSPWEKNALPHRRIEPASAACRSHALTNWATFHPRLYHCCFYTGYCCSLRYWTLYIYHTILALVLVITVLRSAKLLVHSCWFSF